MLRGTTPIQLSQLDITPAIQAAALEQQAAVNLAGSINQAVQNFQAKQEERKQKEMTVSALRSFVPGLSEDLYKAAANDKGVRDNLMLFGREQRKSADLSAKEIEAAQLRGLYPNMPEAIVQDIVYDRLTPEETADNQPTGNFISGSSGQLIDLRDYGIGITSETTLPPSVSADESAPVVSKPTLANQGLYGRLEILDQRGDSPTGLESAVVKGLDSLFTDVFGESPVILDPEIRSFQNDLETNINKFANALKVGTRYSSTEQRDMVAKMEELSSGLGTGAFKNAKELKAAMVSLNKRFDDEIERLERLLDSRRLNVTAKSNYEGMLSSVKEAKKLLGVDLYEQSKLTGLDISAEENELDGLDL